MRLIEFERRLNEVVMVGVLLSTGEPIVITNETALGLVMSAFLTKQERIETGFSGRIFVAIVPTNEGNESVMLIGVPSEWELAEEVES